MKGLLIAHGEKALVALVVLICGFAIYATYANEETESKVEPEELEQKLDRLEEAYRSPGELNLAETRKFEREINNRLQLSVSASPVMAWLHKHPPITKMVTSVERKLYVYETRPPVVEARDQVGRIEVSFSFPDPVRPNAERDVIKDGLDVSWKRDEASGDVINFARRIGTFVEYRILVAGMEADAGWQPLDSANSPGGVVRSASTVALDGVKPWQEYQFRARDLIFASGITGKSDELWMPKTEVLVTTARHSCR